MDIYGGIHVVNGDDVYHGRLVDHLAVSGNGGM